MGNLRILGFDPGVTTGWALVEHEIGTDNFKLISYGEAMTIEDIKLVVASAKFDYCAIESFFLIPRLAKVVAANDPDGMTTQVIGAIKALVAEQKRSIQRPRKKELCPDHRLIELGLMRRESKHVKDALRHCVVCADIYEGRGKINVA